MKKYSIYMNGKKIETRLTLEEAELKVKKFQKQDLYEVSIGYTFPNGMPQYEIR